MGITRMIESCFRPWARVDILAPATIERAAWPDVQLAAQLPEHGRQVLGLDGHHHQIGSLSRLHVVLVGLDPVPLGEVVAALGDGFTDDNVPGFRQVGGKHAAQDGLSHGSPADES